MEEFALQDAYLLDRVVDPTTPEFAEMMRLLMKPSDDGRTRSERLKGKSDWRFVLPFRGDPEVERAVMDVVPVQFNERAVYRNGAASLSLVMADLLDLVSVVAGKARLTSSVLFSAEASDLKVVAQTAGMSTGTLVFKGLVNVADAILESKPETVVFDHTTLNVPVDELLNLAYHAGVHVVDGVFPYHVAGTRGWDTVAGLGKWSYTHSEDCLVVGPDDDCARLLKYEGQTYKKFLDPKLWCGHAKKYGYEIRKCHNGIATYRAVYLGTDVSPEAGPLEYRLPLCSSDDMVLVTINRDLAAGVFASESNNASVLAKLDKNYAIEVRRDLFVSCVLYLVGLDKGTDIVGEAVRYVNQHNYVDLVDGVRIVRCHSLRYADALCVSMVCALVTFQLRYRLTNESLPDIQRMVSSSWARQGSGYYPGFGALGRIAYLLGNYISDAVYKVALRSVDRVKQRLYDTDYIPGVCYEVFMDVRYRPELPWYQPELFEVSGTNELEGEADPFTSFMGGAEKTYAPSVVRAVRPDEKLFASKIKSYDHERVVDPENVLQHEYDVALPGNSVAQLQNVAELRRVKDVNIITEFHGKLEVNKDVAAPERLHVDMPVRTAAIPVSRTPLVDAVMASAKRNFNPPDLQTQSDPWEFAQLLVDRFVRWAFVPNFDDTIGKTYRENPVSFNIQDYFSWLATRSGAYRSALEAECPGELVELNLEKFDTIVKQRIKPKLSTAAQLELAQPQVIVSLSKKDTALFTSLFRVVFERFDSALRSELKSAGRSSDEDISCWLTENIADVVSLLAVEIDSGKYDKSQGLLARMIEARLYERLGLDPGVMEIFGDSFVGRVSSKSVGLMFLSVYQMKSGAPQTMLGNLVYNFVSAGESVGYSNIRLMIAKGDDNVVWLKRSVDRELVVSKMSGLFNLEIKLIVDDVLYFSSGYVVPVGDVVYFVPDPLKILELVGEKGASALTHKERFVSFKDRVRSMTVDERIPRVLQDVVRRRLKVPDLSIVRVVDCYASMADDYELFKRVVPVSP